ncbi:hypothetical protein RB153_15460 [Paenibacillus larvae]|uniref:ATPase involved in DNA repair n=1 Tax=Paenibacillus larvae subsp. larvae DSM 25430 TaxID=697284 RepID=V9W686_9BACL|nr:hypothetical protein [Paenibacillus larvae]AHD06536.1 hypothetical protein ERIC2_c27530 [Paenibacillus larvae subsp. larvae DSM 25430]MDR5568911.1 hypothetical protein [Paenibacillus larvae]MDR5596814.1 hypothetical protein [Paenibacillus larvae]
MYIILLLVPVFFFQAVLIDFARVKAAQKESEQALKAGLRSVLSAFQPDVQTYGLYGIGISQEDSLKLYRNVLDNNLSGNLKAEGFRILDTRTENATSLLPMYTLANHTVLKRQILEEMKIRAPIEFGLEIKEKWIKTGADKLMKQGSVFSKEAGKIEKLLEKREELMDKTRKKFIKLYEKIKERHAYYKKRMNELGSMADELGIHTVDSLKQEVQSVRDSIRRLQEEADKIDGRMESIRDAAETAKEEWEHLDKSKEQISKDLTEAQQKLSSFEHLFEVAVQYFAAIQIIKGEVKQDEKQIHELQEELQPILTDAKKANDELNGELQKVKDAYKGSSEELPVSQVFGHILILSEEDFHSYQTGVASIDALFSGFQTKVLDTDVYRSSEAADVHEKNQAVLKQAEHVHKQQNKVEGTRQKKREEVNSQKKEQKEKISEVLAQLKSVMNGGCTDPGEKGPLHNDGAYKQLEGENGLFRKYMNLNGTEALSGNGVAYELDNPVISGHKSMDLLGKLADVLQSGRDEWFVNEFALTRFNYRTLDLETKSKHALTDPSRHVLAGQEAEYLLYGFSSCKANISTAYAEMFSIRMAIRTLEALMEPKNELFQLGSPLLVLLVSAAQGAVKAFEDMKQLIEGKEVEISSKITGSFFTFTYKDYLRLFFFIHSNDIKLMSRMQSLIEMNTKQDLAKLTTYVQGNTASSLKLWFMPGLMKVFEVTGLTSCEVKGTRCEWKQTAELSY